MFLIYLIIMSTMTLFIKLKLSIKKIYFWSNDRQNNNVVFYFIYNVKYHKNKL